MEELENVILDDDLIPSKPKEGIELFYWISLILLWVGVLLSFVIYWYIDTERIVLLVLLSTCSAVTYVRYKWGVMMTFLLILLGVFCLLNFFAISYTFTFSLGGLGITIDLALLMILCIHYYTNRVVLREVFNSSFDHERTEAEKLAYKRKKVDRFKERFKGKSAYELKILAQNEGLLPEAREAAKEMLGGK